jgi:S1-C subfamily serine protease
VGISSGVGFAIPIDAAKGLVEQILSYGRIVRPALGLAIASPMVLRQMRREGVLVAEVFPGGPAEKAGLQWTSRNVYGVILGDVITSLKVRLQERRMCKPCYLELIPSIPFVCDALDRRWGDYS